MKRTSFEAMCGKGHLPFFSHANLKTKVQKKYQSNILMVAHILHLNSRFLVSH